MSEQLYNARSVKKLNFKIYKQVYTSGSGIYFSRCVKSRLFHRFCNLLTLNVNTEENGNGLSKSFRMRGLFVIIHYDHIDPQKSLSYLTSRMHIDPEIEITPRQEYHR
jgi:hypothetical protein